MSMIKQPQTLLEYLHEYAITRPISDETARQYRVAIGLYLRWRGSDDQPLDTLDELEVSTWLRDYGRTRAAGTVRSKRAYIMSLWRNAADDGYCDGPRRRVRLTPATAPPPVAWTIAEVDQLITTCRRLKRWHPCGLRRSEYWELAIRCAWDTGLRWGDLIAMRVRDVPPDGSVFAVVQHKTRRVAICRLESRTLDLLHASLEKVPRELVVPWPSSGETFRAQFSRLVRKSGIRPGTWKWLRRSSGTDVEVQQWGAAARHLGHADGSRIAYVHYVDPVQLAQHGDRVWPRPLS